MIIFHDHWNDTLEILTQKPSLCQTSLQPRPIKGIFVAMTVRKRTFASSGKLAI